MIQTKADIEQFWAQLDQPTHQYRVPNEGRTRFGSNGAPYPENTVEIEGFLRLLWGVAPVSQLAGHAHEFDYYRTGILRGVDPQDDAYWGKLKDNDQLMVEMASLAVTLIITQETFWETLSPKQQTNLVAWLDQINHLQVPANNWRFFRVLVNTAFEKLHAPFNQAKLDEDLAAIDSMYLGDGWYYDGVPTQRDYYIAWAFHFYGLVYAKTMGELHPKRAQIFKDRAKAFAQDFKYWFDGEIGAGVPFGRSLVYRFAESAFWSALVYADVEALPWGQIKTLLLGNLNYWRQQSLTRADGILSLGYAFENQTMTEAYNAPGSPYWAFKAFLILAVPDDHPFWQAKPRAVPLESAHVSAKGGWLTTNVKGANIQLFPVNAGTQQVHAIDKYNKFVYATRAGFGVQRGSTTYREGCFDNTLALALAGDTHFFAKEADDRWSVAKNVAYHAWHVFDWAQVNTWLVPHAGWHVRIHQITASEALDVIDGGFSVPQYNDRLGQQKLTIQKQPLETTLTSIKGISKAVALSGFERASLQYPEPGTHLLFQNPVYPKLVTAVNPGTHWLVSAFYLGDTPGETPQVTLEAGQAMIDFGGDQVVVSLKS